jgi:CDP-diacylglycerol---serine O-phosphatidyltransferase
MKKTSSGKFPIAYFYPNLVSIIGLCFGMTAIRYSLEGRWELSVGLLVISAFIDGMDGRIARMLDASSKFGAELDSLTDFINFGVAPAIIIYSWSLNELPIKGTGWAICLFYTICCALRLARFNTALDDKSTKNNNFFHGIPAPCGAGMVLVPIMLSFDLEISLFADNANYLAIYLITMAILMASNIPTISVKNLHLNKNFIFPTLILITIFIIFLIAKPWIALPIMGIFYLFTIPCSTLIYLKRNL